MSQSDWELAARWQTPLGANYYIVKRDTGINRFYIYEIVPGQLPTFFGDFGMAGLNFPYGLPVDAD